VAQDLANYDYEVHVLYMNIVNTSSISAQTYSVFIQSSIW